MPSKHVGNQKSTRFPLQPERPAARGIETRVVDGVEEACPDTPATRGRPFGLYVHGNNDTTGAVRSVETATTGLGWEKAAQHVVVTGEPGKADLEACWELGATVAAQLST